MTSKMLKSSLSISMVIPVFNGDHTVTTEIKKAKKILERYFSNYEIIIGDDKSTDMTGDSLRKEFNKTKNIKLLFNSKNLGIARNIKNLYQKATKDYIIFFVADGDWKTKSIEDLIKTLQKTNADIIIGKRKRKGGYTFYRSLISFLHNMLPILLFGVSTIDAGSLKIYRRSLVQETTLHSTSVFLDAEIIIRAHRKGAKIVSTEIEYSKPFTTSGVAAKPSLVLDSLLDLLRLRFSIL